MQKNILISGASGFIGSGLSQLLKERGFNVFQLTRSNPKEQNQIQWHPAKGALNLPPEINFHAVINLAGEPIANGLWTKQKKEKIFSSRVNSTSVLVEAIKQQNEKPEIFLSASAIGYYGDRKDELLTEESEPGTGFLAETCCAWEAKALELKSGSIPVCFARFGIVLNPSGGILNSILPIFKTGLGGKLGNGKQWMSWIALEDVLDSLLYCLDNKIDGPVNVTAPNPVTNSEFTKALANALKRPAVLPVPAFVLRLLPGQFADETLLTSANVFPQKLVQCGYQFKYQNLKEYFFETFKQRA